ATQRLPLLAEGISELVPLTLSVLSFAALYLTVPNRAVERPHALAGGVVAGVGFELTRLGFAAYVKLFPTFKLVYGAFASLPLFLVSLYLTWWVVLLGAVVAAELGGDGER
ncbi:MAG: YihY family inner membrane protein, partial [Rhodocyclaceae bacterium]|nr:YihY family inner membrane protein [Rhodocyclaceae bacterium]